MADWKSIVPDYNKIDLAEKLHTGDYYEVVCGGKVIWKTGDPIPTDAELEIIVQRTRN